MSEQNISARILSDLKDAMRAKDADKLTVLRALKSAISYATIEKHGPDGELSEGDSIAVVRSQIKQRHDSAEKFAEAKREDLESKERAEIVVLENYLPAALDADAVAKLIDEAIAEVGATSKKEMGAVMKAVQEKAAGRVDGKTLSSGVMAKLG
ncbi:MAG: hypothetical protein ACI8XO_002801 [Verrucomicrobiales bacterium]|jgi:uncharacterized protein YqeY